MILELTQKQTKEILENAQHNQECNGIGCVRKWRDTPPHEVIELSKDWLTLELRVRELEAMFEEEKE